MDLPPPPTPTQPIPCCCCICCCILQLHSARASIWWRWVTNLLLLPFICMQHHHPLHPPPRCCVCVVSCHVKSCRSCRSSPPSFPSLPPIPSSVAHLPVSPLNLQSACLRTSALHSPFVVSSPCHPFHSFDQSHFSIFFSCP